MTTTITSAEVFVQTLRRCGLLEPPELNALDLKTAASFTDPRSLARQLLQQGLLTAYQANQLLIGRGLDLCLGHYLLLERLGEGGMGQVFKARHQTLGRVVALKVIRRERVSDQESVRRFRREIQALAQLSHPNIVMAFDADEVGGTHFFVMEFVDGISLSQQVKRVGRLPVIQACNYIRQAALGLQHAFERGLVHRDVKPSNLLVTKAPPRSQQQGMETQVAGSDFGLGPLEFGLLKVLDLGLARLNLPARGEDSSDTLTHHGVLMGTPDFIAAEQAADPHRADIRSDLYSLGCTFYYLLSGDVPFPGGSAVDKLFRHQGEDAVPIERYNPSVPPAVAAIVRRLMAKKPADRYQTPAELAAALTPLVEPGAERTVISSNAPTLSEGLELTPPPQGDEGSFDFSSVHGPAPVEAPRRKARWLAAGALLVVCLAIAGAALRMSRNGGGEAAARPAAAAATPMTGPDRRYVALGTWQESVLATLKANGLPSLEGKWYAIGPFDNPWKDNQHLGFRHAYPPEKETFDAGKTYPGKGGRRVGWKEFAEFKLGQVVDLRIFDDNEHSCIYLTHEFEVQAPVNLPVAFGGDDTVSVWLDGQPIASRSAMKGPLPDHDRHLLGLKPGKHTLLVKVCNGQGPWSVYVMPGLPTLLESAFGDSLRRDFPGKYPGR